MVGELSENHTKYLIPTRKSANVPIACILEQCGRIPCEGETQLSEQKRIFLGSFLKNLNQRKSSEIVTQ